MEQLASAIEQLVKAQARTDQRLGELRGFQLEWRYQDGAAAGWDEALNAWLG